MDPILTSLITNAPIAGAVISTVLLFLKRQKEQGEEFKTTLGQIIESNASSAKTIAEQTALTHKEMAEQLSQVAHEVSRVVDRLDRAEFRQLPKDAA